MSDQEIEMRYRFSDEEGFVEKDNDE